MGRYSDLGLNGQPTPRSSIQVGGIKDPRLVTAVQTTVVSIFSLLTTINARVSILIVLYLQY